MGCCWNGSRGETAEQNNKEPKNALALKRHARQAHEARLQQLQAKAKTQRAASGAAQHSPTHSFIHSLIHSRSHSSAPPYDPGRAGHRLQSASGAGARLRLLFLIKLGLRVPTPSGIRSVHKEGTARLLPAARVGSLQKARGESGGCWSLGGPR